MVGFEGSSASRREFLQVVGATGVLLAAPWQGSLAAASTEQKAGGVLRVGVKFGASKSLDPHKVQSGRLDNIHVTNVYSKLANVDPKGNVIMELAESIEPNSRGDEWTVRLRRAVEFHDGSPLTVDDVIYSYRRILDKEAGFEGYADIQMIDRNGIRKVDDRTIRMRLHYPYAELPGAMAQKTTSIIKDGVAKFDPGSIKGTGPFRFGNIEVDRKATFVKNRNYFQSGLPFVDRLEIIHIPGETAQINALRTNEIDLIELNNLAQIRAIKQDPNLDVLVSESGVWVPIYMNVQAEPFRDVRARQAMRLLADRKQLIDQVQLGLGVLGNDLFGRFDPLYASDLPQRQRDGAEAKSLLKSAGYENYRFVLHTSDAAPGMLSSALVFAQQAQAAGVNVTVQKHPSDAFWTDVWGKFDFGQGAWAHRPLLVQYAQALDPDGPFTNKETHWTDPRTTKLYQEAVRTVDFAKRKELMHDVQRILWEEGGYLIWGFGALASAFRRNVKGVHADVNRPLMNLSFKTVSVA